MKSLDLKQMEQIEGKASGYCWAMFVGTAVGAIGGAFAPFLGASMVYYGLTSMQSGGCF